jgi:hypothetical protein
VQIIVSDDEGRSDEFNSFTISAIDASATISLSSPSVVRQGTAIAGSLSTNVPNPTWSFTTSPTLSVIASGSAFSATGPAQSQAAATTYSIRATATNGGIVASTGDISVTVRKALEIAVGPSGSISGKMGQILTNSPAVSYGGTNIGQPAITLLKNDAAAQIGTLCSGLGLDAATGVISGTPSTACSVTGLRLQAADSDGAKAQSSIFTIDIAGGVVPSDDTFNPFTVTSYVLPEYNTLEISCWGPGGAGATILPNGSTYYKRSDPTGMTVVTGGGRTLCQGNGGQSGNGMSGGSGGETSPLVVGSGGPAAGGNIGSTASSGRGGDGACSSGSGAPGRTTNSSGTNGGTPGGGGSGGKYETTSGGGGGGGSCWKTVINRRDAGAPAPGSVFTLYIGQGGTNVYGAGAFNGGNGGDGQVKIKID